ncbi:PHP domain-containing protein [Candidatus Micrarchaeota archaeon]|nr:PHP domain-containing protein [Candidatus Micrarchaeota archaeon]
MAIPKYIGPLSYISVFVMIDLHIHTNASDGVYSLEEIVEKAENAGLSAIAITDHDTVKNAAKIRQPDSGMEVIPGIEVSVYDNRLNYIDIHLTGLYIDPGKPEFVGELDRIERERDAQKRAIIEKLNELGYAISYGDAKKHAPGSLGRPHIARALMEKYPREFHSIPEAFQKLLDQGKPAFRSRTSFLCLDEAVGMIHRAGGLAFLAHPKVYEDIRGYGMEKLLEDFRRLGGDGIESFYDYASNYGWRGYGKEATRKIIEEFRGYAERYGFLESGGSDFHGPNKGAKLGAFPVPDVLLTRIRAARKDL